MYNRNEQIIIEKIIEAAIEHGEDGEIQTGSARLPVFLFSPAYDINRRYSRSTNQKKASSFLDLCSLNRIFAR